MIPLPPELGATRREELGTSGMRLVASLTRQLGAVAAFDDAAPGARVILEMPL
jgi:hypothetical protein